MTREHRRSPTKVARVKVSKSAIKQAHISKESRPLATATPESRRREPKPSALGSPASLAERLQAEREQIFKAISIVECCKNASATQLDVDDLEYMVPAFDTISELLNTSAGELERIASACVART